MAAKPQWAPIKYTQTSLGGGTNSQGVAFAGGLDLTTPTLRLQPGALRDVLNFEVAQFGGYTRVAGYERIDGQPSPSAATWVMIQFGPAEFDSDFDSDFDHGNFLHLPSVGQVVNQMDTGASGTVIAVVTDPIAYLILANVSGVFNQTSLITGPAT